MDWFVLLRFVWALLSPCEWLVIEGGSSSIDNPWFWFSRSAGSEPFLVHAKANET